jgi:hypothetical protein
MKDLQRFQSVKSAAVWFELLTCDSVTQGTILTEEASSSLRQATAQWLELGNYITG